MGPAAPHRLSVRRTDTRTAVEDRRAGPPPETGCLGQAQGPPGLAAVGPQAAEARSAGQAQAARLPQGSQPAARRLESGVRQPHPGEERLRKGQRQGRSTPAQGGTHQPGGAVGPRADEPRLHGRDQASPSPRKPAAARTAPADRLNLGRTGTAFAYWLAAAARDGAAPPLIGGRGGPFGPPRPRGGPGPSRHRPGPRPGPGGSGGLSGRRSTSPRHHSPFRACPRSSGGTLAVGRGAGRLGGG